MAIQKLWRDNERCIASPSPPRRGGDGGRGGRPGHAGKGGAGGDVYFLGSIEAIAATRDFVVSNFGGNNGENGLPGPPGRPGLGGKGGTTLPACGRQTYPDAKDGAQQLAVKPLNPIDFKPKDGKLVEIELKL